MGVLLQICGDAGVPGVTACDGYVAIAIGYTLHDYSNVFDQATGDLVAIIDWQMANSADTVLPEMKTCHATRAGVSFPTACIAQFFSTRVPCLSRSPAVDYCGPPPVP